MHTRVAASSLRPAAPRPSPRPSRSSPAPQSLRRLPYHDLRLYATGLRCASRANPSRIRQMIGIHVPRVLPKRSMCRRGQYRHPRATHASATHPRERIVSTSVPSGISITSPADHPRRRANSASISSRSSSRQATNLSCRSGWSSISPWSASMSIRCASLARRPHAAGVARVVHGRRARQLGAQAHQVAGDVAPDRARRLDGHVQPALAQAPRQRPDQLEHHRLAPGDHGVRHAARDPLRPAALRSTASRPRGSSSRTVCRTRSSAGCTRSCARTMTACPRAFPRPGSRRSSRRSAGVDSCRVSHPRTPA